MYQFNDNLGRLQEPIAVAGGRKLHFEDFDANNDGVIDRAEWKTLQAIGDQALQVTSRTLVWW